MPDHGRRSCHSRCHSCTGPGGHDHSPRSDPACAHTCTYPDSGNTLQPGGFRRSRNLITFFPVTFRRHAGARQSSMVAIAPAETAEGL